MRRREFIAGLGVALAVPLSARAQQRQRVWRIGSLSAGSSSGQNEPLNAFMKELNDLGYGGIILALAGVALMTIANLLKVQAPTASVKAAKATLSMSAQRGAGMIEEAVRRSDAVFNAVKPR
jgi:hypothetical protein